MIPEQLLENFKSQQQAVAEEIRKAEMELAQKKELYVKLQGAIEGFTLLTGETEEPEVSPAEVVEE